MLVAAAKALLLSELAELWDEVEPVLKARLIKVVTALIALAFAGGVGGVVVYTQLNAPYGHEVTGTEVKTVPAEGVESYPAKTFCDDPLTRMRAPVQVPDGAGTTYVLERIRDGKTETVVFVLTGDKSDISYARHNFDTSQGQGGEPAIFRSVAEALACIKSKS